MLEILRDADEQPGVHLLGGLKQDGLRLAHLGRPYVLGSPGHRDRVLIADLAAGQRFFRSRQLLELPGGLYVLGRGAGGQLAMRAQPGHHAQRTVGTVAAGFLKAASGVAVRPLHSSMIWRPRMIAAPSGLADCPASQPGKSRSADSIRSKGVSLARHMVPA